MRCADVLWIRTLAFSRDVDLRSGGPCRRLAEGRSGGASLKVVDAHTLAIPTGPGNHRYDGFTNIIETGRIGLVVLLVPNRNEVVRSERGRTGSSGTGHVAREHVRINGARPNLAGLRRYCSPVHCARGVSTTRQGRDPLAPLGARGGGPGRGPSDLSEAPDGPGGGGKLARGPSKPHLKNNDENRLFDELRIPRGRSGHRSFTMTRNGPRRGKARIPGQEL